MRFRVSFFSQLGTAKSSVLIQGWKSRLRNSNMELVGVQVQNISDEDETGEEGSVHISQSRSVSRRDESSDW